VAATLFIGLGGVLAGLNHTRHDVAISNVKAGWTLYDSKHHDVHHRIPQSNYGQYTVLWDRVFGTFREYDEKDRVNPAYQLDPCTGRTIIKE
jgi:sterol desaturase/sphingolipid hydroxylase (fatty acid hydroxylase superfamily)